MLQALRFVIQGAGAKVDAAIRKNIVSLLLGMLGHDEVWLRVSGCTAEPTASRLRLFSLCCVGDWFSCQLGVGNTPLQMLWQSGSQEVFMVLISGVKPSKVLRVLSMCLP